MSDMTEDWTERYRPKTLSAVKGNDSSVKKLVSWARSWDKGTPEKRAVVLMGTPGTGKTSSAEALANDMGWDIIEMNASDQRTGNMIRDIAGRGSFFNSLGMDEEYRSSKDGRRKLIVLDEADNLFGNADRGALPAINDLIKTTKQPLILIVNDFYALSKKSSTVKQNTLQITFKKPDKINIVEILREIIKNEGMTADDLALQRIAENANGDIRAAVRDLEALSQGRDVLEVSATDGLHERIVKKDMNDVLRKMFREDDPMGAKRTLSETDVDPETALLWVDENLPYEYREPGDLVRGYEKLSKADVFLGRVRRRQYYGMWSYATDMMTIGVSSSKFSSKTSVEKFRFPLYLMKMSRSKSVRALKSSLCYKLARYLHTSTKRVEMDILDPMRVLAANDPDVRIALIADADLEPEELGFLLDTKGDSDIVREAVRAASERNAERINSKKDSSEETLSKPSSEQRPQSNLFDF